MAVSRTIQTFEVSKPLFSRMTEGIRLHSNEVEAPSSLAELIEARRCVFLLGLRRHELGTLREHFATVPSQGPIRIECGLSSAGSDCLAKARNWLTTELGFEASAVDVVSALLFDYAVERAAAHMLDSLGVGSSLSGRGASLGEDGRTKPIPIK